MGGRGCVVLEDGESGLVVVAGHEFGGYAEVGLGADGGDVVEDYGLAEGRGFGESDVSGDDVFEDPGAEVVAGFRGDLSGEVEAGVVHGQEDAVDGEVRVYASLDQVDRVEELREAFEGVVLALYRDEQAVRGGEHVDGDEAQGWWAVYEYVVVLVPERVERVGHDAFPLFSGDHFDFGACEVRGGWQDVQVSELYRSLDGVLDRGVSGEDVVDGGLQAVLFEADAGGGVALRVAVDQESATFGDGERRCEIDGGGSLTDAALLVGYGDDAGHGYLV